ncbi:MAG: efflux RND transporter permease subunit [Planctomycetota bacterium]|jgi:HAE1 family hydrophobic/amphiphilic exporter-1
MEAAQHSAFRFATMRPVAITMMVLAAVVFGAVGLRQLPLNLLPEISYPTLTIRTEYPGASPEDVEERISERLQESVAVVPGMRRVVSISRPEISDIILEFAWGTEMVFAISDIRERIDRVVLPREADKPLVLRYDPSLDPMMTIGLSGDDSLVRLRLIAEEEIERELAKLEGLAAVKIRGGDEEEILIGLDEQALSLLGLDVETVGRRLAEENVNTASGTIEEGNTQFLVRTLGEFQNLEEIETIILDRRNDAPIRLSDVARVSRQPKDKEVISRIDGRPCVLIDIYREAGANLVELAERVRHRVFGTEEQQVYAAALAADPSLMPRELALSPEELQAEATNLESLDEWSRAMISAERARVLADHRRNLDFLVYDLEPFALRFDLLQDQSEFIESAIDDLRSSAIKGGLFAILVIFIFLRRLSATVILAASIPISLVASFAPMYLSEITLNIMSLGGLALGVGMLVDNSIVVLESVSRCREAGLGIREAAVQGVSRVASAVTASTLTTVAVFFPIVFVEGVAGQLFRDQSLTVVYSLLMSLLVALFVIPMFASRGADPVRECVAPSSRIGRFSQGLAAGTMRAFAGLAVLIGKVLGMVIKPATGLFDRFYRSLDAAYPGALKFALRSRWLVLSAALAVLSLAGWRLGSLGSELIPEVSQGELFVDIFLPRDAAVERTDSVASPLESQLRQLPEVERTFLAVGVDREELNSSEEGEHSARILVKLRDEYSSRESEEFFRAKARELILAIPEIESYRFNTPSVLNFSAPLVVEVVGRDLVALRETSTRVVEALDDLPGLRDVRSTMQRGNPEIIIHLDRDKMSALGIDSGTVTRILQSKVLGDLATRFAERDRKVDIRVALSKEELDRVDRLLAINVNPAGNPEIPLGSVGRVQRLEGPSEIRRIGNVRGAEVQAAVVGFDIGTIQSMVMGRLQSLDLPKGIDLRLGGQKEEMERSTNSVFLALGLAIFLVYIVMASQFESLIQPFIILVSLPLAFVGVILVLELTSTPVSVIALLGCIMLAGIVVNNAIIMVDQINRLRAEGMSVQEAVVKGAHTRLRPVLMTTMTTILGLLPLTGWLNSIPLLGGNGEGLELRAPMAITVIAGLAVSTLLTLIVIPVIYSLVGRRVHA